MSAPSQLPAPPPYAAGGKLASIYPQQDIGFSEVDVNGGSTPTAGQALSAPAFMVMCDGQGPPASSTVRYDDEPTTVRCVHCNELVSTKTRAVAGGLTYISALLCCLIAPLGCCLLPFCFDRCQDIHHNCPSCGAHLGVFKRL